MPVLGQDMDGNLLTRPWMKCQVIQVIHPPLADGDDSNSNSTQSRPSRIVVVSLARVLGVCRGPRIYTLKWPVTEKTNPQTPSPSNCAL